MTDIERIHPAGAGPVVLISNHGAFVSAAYLKEAERNSYA